MLLSAKTVIRCRDFAASRRFYAEVLALTVVDEWQEDGGRGALFALNTAREGGLVEIYEMTTADRRYDVAFTRPVASDKIDLQLRTDTLSAWIDSLRGSWPFDGPQTLPWGQTWIKLRDPDGFLVAIYQGEG